MGKPKWCGLSDEVYRNMCCCVVEQTCRSGCEDYKKPERTDYTFLEAQKEAEKGDIVRFMNSSKLDHTKGKWDLCTFRYDDNSLISISNAEEKEWRIIKKKVF